MAIYPLSRWVCFGKLDSSDPIDFDFEVSEAEYALLKTFDDAGHVLKDAPELADLYGRALEEATQLFVDDIRAHLEPDEEDDSDYYDYHVGFRA